MNTNRKISRSVLNEIKALDWNEDAWDWSIQEHPEIPEYVKGYVSAKFEELSEVYDDREELHDEICTILGYFLE